MCSRRSTIGRLCLSNLAVVAAVAVLLLAFLAAPSAAVPVGGSLNVDGKKVYIKDWDNAMGSGGEANVYEAKTGGQPAVLKALKAGKQWGQNEVAATKAAGQYIAHDDDFMVQKKVGTHDLPGYLKEKQENPDGWKPSRFEIMRQINKQQEKAGYLHLDSHPENIRVDTTVTKKNGAPRFRLVDWGAAKKPSEVSHEAKSQNLMATSTFLKTECQQHGFAFRDGGSSDRLYRRAGGAGCSVKSQAGTGARAQGSASDKTGSKTAAVKPAQKAGGGSGGSGRPAASASKPARQGARKK
ncbi:hypothetical protein DFJ73DRAFT_770875 [Zopfochytrium polystomum]|nr:hypothetical protein DFJ73DRAFT_770875 [Zopfochytrium polystomum]